LTKATSRISINGRLVCQRPSPRPTARPASRAQGLQRDKPEGGTRSDPTHVRSRPVGSLRTAAGGVRFSEALTMRSHPSEPIRVFLCGDVMTGRGIDQILPYPVSPVLYESSVRDARDYVRLAERVSGPIPRPVDVGYIWGDALAELERAGTEVRIIN